MSYSEDFWKCVVVNISAMMERRKQQQSAAKTSARA